MGTLNTESETNELWDSDAGGFFRFLGRGLAAASASIRGGTDVSSAEAVVAVGVGPEAGVEEAAERC